ncbi:MAG: GTP-binding protein [Thermoplasmata archaeon]|nr:MAG: GTP-binding protein [Thermoplasmata archaeon]
MPNVQNYVKKVVLIGDESVGKTSMIRRFVLDKFDDRYISTLGTKVTKRNLTIREGSSVNNITFMIWDIMGQKRFEKIQSVAFKNAHGSFIVCDVTKKDSLEHIEVWLDLLYRVTRDIPLVLLANKIDLEEQCVVQEDDVKEIASKYGVPYYFTSAKTGENVNKAFLALGKLMVRPFKGYRTRPTQTVTPVRKDGEVTILDVEDEIIAKFCDEMEGFDLTMPMIRQQFEKENVDFRNPNKEQLIRVVNNLITAAQVFKDPEALKKLRKDLMQIVYNYEKSEKKLE